MREDSQKGVEEKGVMSKFAIKGKYTTLMVFDLILSQTLNLALSPSPMNTVISQ